MKSKNRTIFAPATPIGESSITVIRISGKDTFIVLGEIFSKNVEKFSRIDFSKISSHTAHHGYIFDGDEILDEVVVVIFKAPNSYTGEDVCEISTHGGRVVYKSIVSLLSKKGAEFAEPGEFSKRAFLNGKVDLTQTEAISDLIRAKTDLSYKAAKRQFQGAISDKITVLRNDLLNYCSLVELELDFSEEELEIIDKSILITKIDNILQNVENLANSYQSGKIIKNGINLTITGKPNVGKSSLFNYLLNDSRAIVSEIPGTTRDYLEESLILGGFIFNLVDTAGIRKTSNVIEQKGVEKSYKKIQEADLVINVIDLTDKSEIIESIRNGRTIPVYNKADLISALPKDNLCVSALTGYNMDKLENTIIEEVKDIVKEDSLSEIFITSERQRNLLLKSCEYLVNARKLVIESAGNELISFEIREAMNKLDEIIGKTTNVDILNNIFSKFCIGK